MIRSMLPDLEGGGGGGGEGGMDGEGQGQRRRKWTPQYITILRQQLCHSACIRYVRMTSSIGETSVLID